LVVLNKIDLVIEQDHPVETAGANSLAISAIDRPSTAVLLDQIAGALSALGHIASAPQALLAPYGV